jgi:hypothetical protein
VVFWIVTCSLVGDYPEDGGIEFLKTVGNSLQD